MYGFQVRAAGTVVDGETIFGPASNMLGIMPMADNPLTSRMIGTMPPKKNDGDSGWTLSPNDGCRVEAAVEFLDGDGNAVEVETLAASDFTVENGRLGTPVKDADGPGWKVPAWAPAGFTGLMRIGLAANARWVAAEQARGWRVSGC